MERKAKVFNTGRSQAVRLLSEFRFNTKEVFVRRDATTGDVILSTKPESKSLDEVFARLDAAGIPMLLLSLADHQGADRFAIQSARLPFFTDPPVPPESSRRDRQGSHSAGSGTDFPSDVSRSQWSVLIVRRSHYHRVNSHHGDITYLRQSGD
jgi:antitoxin VapB